MLTCGCAITPHPTLHTDRRPNMFVLFWLFLLFPALPQRILSGWGAVDASLGTDTTGGTCTVILAKRLGSTDHGCYGCCKLPLSDQLDGWTLQNLSCYYNPPPSPFFFSPYPALFLTFQKNGCVNRLAPSKAVRSSEPLLNTRVAEY